MIRLRAAVGAALVAPALMVNTSSLKAQDVQYETLTKIELPGALGTMMRIGARLGGGSTEMVETTSIKGARMRSDLDQTSTILDLEGRRFIELDHRARTYLTYTFDEMVARARQAGEEARAGAAERPRGDDAAETHLSFRFNVEQAGQRERIAGYNADRFFLTMEAEGEFTPEEGGAREKGGTLVILTDLWTSKDMPAYTAQQSFRDASAQEFASAASAMMEGLTAALAEDPRLKVGLEQSVQEIRKMEGMAMRSVTRFVAVAPEQAFDRHLALEEAPREGAARQAGRAALRGLAGRAARAAGGGQPEPSASEEQTQATIVKITSEVRNVRSASLDASLFEIPAGYRDARGGE